MTAREGRANGGSAVTGRTLVQVDALVERAREGDRAAFGVLVERFRPRIYALGLHLTGSRTEADDIAQEAFLRAWDQIATFEGRSQFFTWLYRIAVNRALNGRRDGARRRTVTLDDPRVQAAVAVDAYGDPRRGAELRQTYTRLVTALDALSPTLRSTVVLVALQGMSHDEAGVILGCPSGTVAWRMHEARGRLRAAIDGAREERARASADDEDEEREPGSLLALAPAFRGAR